MLLYNNVKIAAYAAAAEAFDNSQDLFKGFLPLVETALCLDGKIRPVSFIALRQRINEVHGVEIEKETLRYLISILEAQGKVEFDRKTVHPIQPGISESVERIYTSKASIDLLFREFLSYLTENGCSISITDLRNQVCEWIYLHSSDLAKFIASGADKTLFRITGNNDWEYADSLISFLVECFKEKPEVYRTFIRLYDGAVQASLLNFTPNEISSVVGREFLVKSAVLDTNFVLRLIGLQAPLDNEVALSTFQNLREVDVELYVLTQTIEEICSSVDGFLKEIEPVAQQAARFLPKTNIVTSGFWSAFKNGVSRTDFLEWTNPDKVIRELTATFSITVIDDYENPTIADETIRDLISYKDVDKYAEKQATHDLTLIAYCQAQRSKRPHPLGEAKWWVLTNDAKLASWNRHRNKAPACMTTVQVSNLLWLFTKKDSGEGLTNTIVSLAGRDAASSTDISNFVTRMDRYSEKYRDDPHAIDNLSNVLAHAAFTTNDIKQGSSSDSEFLSVVDKRTEEIQRKIKLEEAEHAKAEDSHAEEVAKLKQEVELEKWRSQKKQKENNVNAAQVSIDQIEKSISQVEDIKAFCDKRKGQATRRVLLGYIGVIAFIVLVAILARKLLAALATKYAVFADQMATYTGVGVVAVGAIPLYYLIVILVFNHPYGPKELFLELQKRSLLRQRGKYIIKQNLSTDFAQGELETHLADLKNQLSQERDNLLSLQSELQEIEDKMDALRS